MKNVYIIQVSNNLSSSVFLPYSAGLLAAYAFKHEEVRKNFNLCDFIFIKQPLEVALKEIKEPAVAAFSSYMWNIEYNLALAEKVKEAYPECIIIFGGPQIPDNLEYLNDYPFIDILIHGEGEIPFYNILKNFGNSNNLAQIPNISLRTGSELIQTPKAPPFSLEDLPSPYESGLFDGIINNPKYKHLSFDAVVETNRGCPYGCIYCYWSRSGADFRKFDIERVKRDIEWIAKNKIEYCVCADGNFGIIDRDESIADFVIETNKKYGYPKRFETATDKNKTDLSFRINQKLEKANLNRGVSVAVQSMSKEVLQNIGRKNMSFEKFAYELAKYRKNNIDTYTELILGLPGETLESFCKGLFAVVEAGQHYSIAVHPCEVFPNTAIYSDEIREKYKIKTISSQLCQIHSEVNASAEFSSRSQIIVQTSTMSSEEWYCAQRISICAQAFHSLGLLRFFAVYLRKAKNISYYDFYMKLYDWIENESVAVKRFLDKTTAVFPKFLKGEGNLYFADSRFGNIYWNFNEGMFLTCAAELDLFFADVRKYLCSYFTDNELFEDLFNYQKEMIALPSEKEKEIETLYDWHKYFSLIFDNSVTFPERKSTRLKFQPSATDNWIDYAREVVWYGKRSGKSLNKAEYV